MHLMIFCWFHNYHFQMTDVSEYDMSDVSGNDASDTEVDNDNPWDNPENVSWRFLKTGKIIF